MISREIILSQFLELRQKCPEKAIGFVIEHYGDALYGILNKILPSKALSDDAFQEGMIKVWRNLSDYDPEKSHLFTWLLTILRNTAIDILRIENRRKNQNEPSDVYENMNIGEEPKIADIGLFNTISKLEMKYKELIELIYIQGYTQQEAADKLQLPLGTVKTRINTALKNLRNILSALYILIVNIYK